MAIPCSAQSAAESVWHQSVERRQHSDQGQAGAVQCQLAKEVHGEAATLEDRAVVIPLNNSGLIMPPFAGDRKSSAGPLHDYLKWR